MLWRLNNRVCKLYHCFPLQAGLEVRKNKLSSLTEAEFVVEFPLASIVAILNPYITTTFPLGDPNLGKRHLSFSDAYRHTFRIMFCNTPHTWLPCVVLLVMRKFSSRHLLQTLFWYWEWKDRWWYILRKAIPLLSLCSIFGLDTWNILQCISIRALWSLLQASKLMEWNSRLGGSSPEFLRTAIYYLSNEERPGISRISSSFAIASIFVAMSFCLFLYPHKFWTILDETCKFVPLQASQVIYKRCLKCRSALFDRMQISPKLLGYLGLLR